MTVTFVFPTKSDIYKFCSEVDVRNFEVNLLAHILTCDCTYANRKLATSKYGARVILDEPENSNSLKRLSITN
jgi:hypothetical protein